MKKVAAKNKTVAAKNTATGTTRTKGKKPVVAKQPQSKQEAALKAGIFLHTDDAWSKAYYDKNDLHFKERELFAMRPGDGS